MVLALICASGNPEAELGHTLLWRTGVERRLVRSVDEAKAITGQAPRPEVLVLDRDLPGAEAYVTSLRQDVNTRQMSIVIMAGGDFEANEIGLLEAGANAILRLPAGDDWDDRLERLIEVPVRRDGRFSVFFKVEALTDGDPAPIMATALNLSVSGMLLESPMNLAVGDELAMQFRVPEQDELVKCKGRVVRLAGPKRVGLGFIDVSPNAPEAIRRFVTGTRRA
jgi:CheY-like chemotaxis protein